MELQKTLVSFIKEKNKNKLVTGLKIGKLLYLISKAYLGLCKPTQGLPKVTNGH